MPAPDVARAVLPLRLLFWGGVLCILDFRFTRTIAGRPLAFDVFDDVVGCGLIAFGAWRLRALAVDRASRAVLTFATVVAVLQVADAVREHGLGPWPAWVGLAALVLGLVTMGAVALFFVAMVRLSEAAGLFASVRSWRVTWGLHVAILVLPVGWFWGAALEAWLRHATFHLPFAVSRWVLIPALLLPLLHLFVSTSRMRYEAQRLAAVEGVSLGAPPT